MQTIGYAVLSLQGQVVNSVFRSLFDEHADRAISNTRVLLTTLNELLIGKEVETSQGCSLRLWPPHHDEMNILVTLQDAIGQGFDTRVEVYSASVDAVAMILYFQLHCGRTAGGENARYMTKKQKNSISEIISWASTDWGQLGALIDPACCVKLCSRADTAKQAAAGPPLTQLSLHAVYDEIRSHTKRRVDNRTTEANGKVTGVSALERQARGVRESVPLRPRDFLMRLPIELAAAVMIHLDPCSLHALSCCSKAMRRDCDGIIPGLQLRLYPHQYDSVWWMLDRERPGKTEVSIQYKTFYKRADIKSALISSCSDKHRCSCTTEAWNFNQAFYDKFLGVTGFYPVLSSTVEECSPPSPLFYHDLLSGDILHPKYDSIGGASPPPEILIKRTRGGMLCDEPGLGKSITMMAVILRSLGARSGQKLDRCSEPPVCAKVPLSPPPRSSPSSRIKRRRSVGVSPPEAAQSPHGTRKVGVDCDVGGDANDGATSSGLITTHATLVAVPETLLDHWRLQADCHIARGIGCKVYVDDASSVTKSQLPSAEYLAGMHIVVIGHRRLGQEWKKTFPTTSLEDAILSRSQMLGGVGTGKRGYTTNSDYQDISILHKIYWLRLAVDEGHTIGKGPNSSNASLMASSLRAERRWVLTGTPTPSGLQVAVSTQLRYLLTILKFLGCEPFNLPTGDRIWKALIQLPFELGSRTIRKGTPHEKYNATTTEESVDDNVESSMELSEDLQPTSRNMENPKINLKTQRLEEQRRIELMEAVGRLNLLLSEMMVRHVKDDVAAIPKPIYRQTHLTMGDEERSSYNAMVALVQSNVVTTEHDYVKKNGTHQDSLLNPMNKKYLADMMLNIRIAACGGGTARLTVPSVIARLSVCLMHLARFELRKATGAQNCDPIIAGCSDVNNSIGVANANEDIDSSKMDAAARVQKFRSYVFKTLSAESKLKCEWCGIELILLLVTPCVHLYCTDCVNRMGDYCELCREHFNWNDFQQLQPGFEASEYQYEGKIASSNAVAGRGGEGRNNTDRQIRLDNNDNGTIANDIGSIAVPFFDDEAVDTSSVDMEAEVGRETISSKAKYLISKIQELEDEHMQCVMEEFDQRNLGIGCLGDTRNYRSGVVVPKIIVFSQYLAFLDQIVIDLRTAGVNFSFFNGKQKTAALRRFRYCPDVRVLILHRDGSHGLDLSFVTHIFLMDTVFDESLEQQVVSRAYRMGARRSVVVDQLIMTNTIEENIYRQRHGSPEPDERLEVIAHNTDQDVLTVRHQARGTGAVDRHFSRLQRLVAGLRLVRSDAETKALSEAWLRSTKVHPHGFWFDTSKKCSKSPE